MLRINKICEGCGEKFDVDKNLQYRTRECLKCINKVVPVVLPVED